MLCDVVVCTIAYWMNDMRYLGGEIVVSYRQGTGTYTMLYHFVREQGNRLSKKWTYSIRILVLNAFPFSCGSDCPPPAGGLARKIPFGDFFSTFVSAVLGPGVRSSALAPLSVALEASWKHIFPIFFL
jgi:hypothetical protein